MNREREREREREKTHRKKRAGREKLQYGRDM